MGATADALALTAVLTTAGTVSFAALITGFIALLKALSIPMVAGNEPRVAALLALVFVVLGLAAAITGAVLTLDLQTLFLGFTAWYALARLSMGIHDDISASPRSLTTGLQGS